jgi:oligoribonuclease (3'-5' exoribonuclease)
MKDTIAVKIQTIQEIISFLEEMKIRAFRQAELSDKIIIRRAARNEVATLNKVIRFLNSWLEQLQGGE